MDKENGNDVENRRKEKKNVIMNVSQGTSVLVLNGYNTEDLYYPNHQSRGKTNTLPNPSNTKIVRL
jgi:hypothetical protein